MGYTSMPMISVLALLGLIIGLAAERKKLISGASLRWVSWILVQVIYPCLIFSSLSLRFQSADLLQLWPLPALIFLLLLLGLGFGLVTQNRMGLSEDRTKRSYVFLAIMPNYSFVPLVIAQSFFGDLAVGYIAFASIGADIFLWTLGFPQIAGRFSVQKLLSPALISVLLALFLKFFVKLEASYFDPFLQTLNGLGKLTLPLSMFVLGIQLMRAPLKIAPQLRKAHQTVWLWRLVLGPAFLFSLLFFVDIPKVAKAALLLSGSMPGAIVSVVLSELYNADSNFAATSIFWGHILGILTVTLWQLALFFL